VAVDSPDARSATEQDGAADPEAAPDGRGAATAAEPAGGGAAEGVASASNGRVPRSAEAPKSESAQAEATAESGSDDDGEEPDGVARTKAGVRKPVSALGWVVFPFAVIWRFLFPKTPRPFLVELPFLVVFALFLAFLIKTFLVQAFFIPSGSMQNTLAIGDRVLVNRASVWMGSQPQRGEVVVFSDPGGWLGEEGTTQSSNWLTTALTWVGILPANDGDLIKRVIGMPGDHVACCNAQGDVTVNNVALNETYLYPGDSPGSGEDGQFSVTVPAGDLWVMGDHRSISADSRAHQDLNGGFVPIKDVVGQAFVIIWPPSQWGTLPVPSTFHQTSLSALSTPGAIPAAGFAMALPVTLLRRRHRFADERKRRRRRRAMGASGAGGGSAGSGAGAALSADE
jgi:signal peptidase I